jgi:hypothetical protein
MISHMDEHLTWTSSTLGNLATNCSANSRPSGAPPTPTASRDVRSNCNTSGDLASATINGGTAGMEVTLCFSTALNMARNSNFSINTMVEPRATWFNSMKKPKIWNRGIGKSTTIWGDASSPAAAAIASRLIRRACISAMEAIKFLCVSLTPLTRPVVPDEYSIAAVSDCLITGNGEFGRLQERRDVKEGESRRIIGILEEILGATEETEKAIEGLQSVIWCMISEEEEAGLAGETTTPIEISAK